MKSNKTLLEILLDELPKRGGWPDGANYMACDSDGCIDSYINMPVLDNTSEYWVDRKGDGYLSKIIKENANVAYDWKTAIITRDQYETALPEKDEGWIKWDGGDCPVNAEEMVVAKLRNGKIWMGGDAVRARNLDWSNEGSSLDVVAYRLSKPEEITDQEGCGDICSDLASPCVNIESLTDAIIDYGCEANLAYPLAKHLLASGLIK